jgi:peptidoglycan/xylan/chitin deacetylase (PgdA/CDA1 family)
LAVGLAGCQGQSHEAISQVLSPVAAAANVTARPTTMANPPATTPAGPPHAAVAAEPTTQWTGAQPQPAPLATGGWLPANPAPPVPALKLICRGLPSVPAVALTFDDGPHPDFTPRILQILAENNVHATFFVVGKMVALHPELVRAEYQAGHTVGNHTYDHPDLARMSQDDVHHQWSEGSRVLREITGVAPRFCRPPGGEHNDMVVQVAADLGLTTVMWSDSAGDYGCSDAGYIRRATVQGAKNGAIILLHDGVEQTVEVLPQIIAGLREKGFTFQTLDEMAQALDASEAARS